MALGVDAELTYQAFDGAVPVAPIVAGPSAAAFVGLPRRRFAADFLIKVTIGLFVSDALSVALGALIGWAGHRSLLPPSLVVCAVSLNCVAGTLLGTYQVRSGRVPPYRLIALALLAWGITICLPLFVPAVYIPPALLVPASAIPAGGELFIQSPAIRWWVATALLIAMARRLVAQWLAGSFCAQAMEKRVVVVGDIGAPERLRAALKTISPRTVIRGARSQSDGIDGQLVDEVLQTAEVWHADEIALSMRLPDETLRRLVQGLAAMPVDLRLCPDGSFGVELERHFLEGVGGGLLVRRPIAGWAGYSKRFFDVVGSLLLMITCLPLMVIIGAAVRLDSDGPIFFSQWRGGFDRRPFRVLKFRSMHPSQAEIDEVIQARPDDARVTRVGRLLRRTSLDELPQLFNVLRGDMSLVGPRPHALSHDAHFGDSVDFYLARYRVKPGITGWAQIHGLRGQTETVEKMEKRVRYDLFYIQNWSLFLDLRILAKTALLPLGQKNAY